MLLEILDPEQNTSFTDDYIDAPIDLSKVLFICTANILQTLHPALLDRMEIINVSGYTHNEKKHIYSKYLVPEAIKKAGLNNEIHDFLIIYDAVEKIIHDYCWEPGVWSLQRYINTIMEKIAFKIVKGEKQVIVTPSNLEDYIGSPKFDSKRIYDKTPPGVVIGLAYNQYGGSILFIEATRSSFKKEQTGGL